MRKPNVPIYEYRCDDCSHELEALQKLSDPKLTTCPECGNETLTKLVSAAAFVLKGSGWYQTDFRDKDKPEAKSNENGDNSSGESAASSDSQSAAKSGDQAESKSESKPDDSKGQSESKSDSKQDKKAAGE